MNVKLIFFSIQLWVWNSFKFSRHAFDFRLKGCKDCAVEIEGLIDFQNKMRKTKKVQLNLLGKNKLSKKSVFVPPTLLRLFKINDPSFI